MDDHQLQIWAHRGGAHLGSENSLRAVKSSLSHNISGVHINVQRLSDDTLVLFADETFDEKTTGRGWVRYTPLTDFTTYRANNEPMCTLVTFLPWYIESTKRMYPRPTLNIEIPDQDSMKSFLDFIQEPLSTGELKVNDILVSSSDWGSLRMAHRVNPSIPLAGIFYGSPLHFADYMQDVPLRACHIDGSFVNSHFVREVLAMHITVRIIGVNNPDHVMRYVDMGVSGIITDAPDIVR